MQPATVAGCAARDAATGGVRARRVRVRRIAAAICFTLLPALPASAAAQAHDPEAAALLDAWVAMWNRYDLSGVDRLFVTDGTVTYFSSERDGRILGIDALRVHHAGFGFVAGGIDQPNRLWLEHVDVRVREGAFVVTAEWRFRRGGETAVQRGPVTFVLVRTADGLRIAHAHFANAIDG